MTDRALRELERAAGHDPAARSRLLEARIRAGGVVLAALSVGIGVAVLAFVARVTT